MLHTSNPHNWERDFYYAIIAVCGTGVVWLAATYMPYWTTIGRSLQSYVISPIASAFLCIWQKLIVRPLTQRRRRGPPETHFAQSGNRNATALPPTSSERWISRRHGTADSGVPAADELAPEGQPRAIIPDSRTTIFNPGAANKV